MSAMHFVFSRVVGAEPTERGLRATVAASALGGTTTEVLEVDVVREDIVRLRMSVDGIFEESPSHAVCVDPLGLEVAPTTDLDAAQSVWRVSTGSLVVEVAVDPFDIRVVRPDGSLVLETSHDDAEAGACTRLASGGFRLRRSKRPGDGLYGLGEKTGSFNRNGRDFTMWNTDVLNPYGTAEFRAGRAADDPRADNASTEFDPYYLNIPLIYHHPNAVGAMSGSFIDNPYRAHYDLRPDDELVITFDGGQWTEYVFAGPSMPQILEAYTWLTGRMTMPPAWALGYHQCRWKAYTQLDMETLAARIRAEDIPCDTLWLDIDYMDGYRVFTWSEQRFPDPPAMLERLAAQGFRVITIIDPGVKQDPGYAVYDDGIEQDVFARTADGQVYIGQVWPGDTAFPDFARQEARDWWGALNAAHVESGLAGIWNDMNEPATGDVPAEGMWFEQGTVPHGRYHNEYALLMAMGTWEGLDAARPGEPKFILSRAGSPGIQRYAANWMGDNQSRWDHLALSIPMACGLGISGQPFVGADCGGFQGDTNAELFDRWMQMGALTPFFRNHTETGTIDQYPWSFGPDVLDHVREAIRLRYAILPYIQQAFAAAAATGEPVQRPYVFDHQDDPVAATVEDAYLFGRDLIVAPVIAAGVSEREVYLPAGRWRDVASTLEHEGGQWLTVPTPAHCIPLFTRVDTDLDAQLASLTATQKRSRRT